MIDMHCHVLPRVDDGPDSTEESLEILEEAYKQGVRYMILTPHYRPEMFETSLKDVISTYKIFREQAKEFGIRISLGCECYRHEAMVQRLNGKKLLTLGKSKYVLVEFSSHDLFSTIRSYVYELKSNGYRPVIAHVERYVACQSLENIKELKELGALIQVNAGSVIGESGWLQKGYCLKLMKADLIDFIASDTHNTEGRKMNLKKCFSYVKRKMGKRYAKKIFVDNPSEILKDRVNR